MGVSSEHPAIAAALQALRTEDGIIYRGIGRPGKILDQLGLGGSQMIRAVVFAYAGVANEPCVEEQTRVALEAFKSILPVGDIGEITTEYRTKLVFRPGAMLPSIYHLRLLAHTSQWRTREKYQLVVEGVRRLVELSPIPAVYASDRTRLIAPASFAMRDFNPNMQEMSDAMWAQWFQRMELLVRIGVPQAIKALDGQLKMLDELLQEGNGWFARRLAHTSFMRWGVYTGLALEEDWRTPTRRSYDLTFRSLLIKHLSQASARPGGPLVQGQ
jgi:hypothetical protein